MPNSSDYWALPDDLYSSTDIRGSYHPLQFVVRLNPQLKSTLDAINSGVVANRDASNEVLMAFSTYLHESIHWWQYIGSTTGLMLSFASPAQCHVNLKFLKQSLVDFGPKKSLRTLLDKNYTTIPDASRKRLNTILNNWHDVEFNRHLLLDTSQADQIINSPFFECLGHSLYQGLLHTLWLLSATFDRDLNFLPDFRQWEDGFGELRKRRITDFFYGSYPVAFMPIGALHIFEGQARFGQIQYLHRASGGKLTWIDFDRMGMLESPYYDAFDLFLKATKINFPNSVVDPSVQLFLLLCDLAINPGDGYPFQIRHYESFLLGDDPAKRFWFFCHYIAKHPELATAIQNCSRDEYLTIASELCHAMPCETPLAVAAQLTEWAQTKSSLISLLEEDTRFEFSVENLPVRVCYARHLRLMRDKARRPDFFCWPGMCLADTPSHSNDLGQSIELWKEHEPLFNAEIGGEVRPICLPNRDLAKTQKTFNDFYTWNLLYDAVRQWTVSDGPFSYDYRWLTPSHSTDIAKPTVERAFGDVFGISLGDFTDA